MSSVKIISVLGFILVLGTTSSCRFGNRVEPSTSTPKPQPQSSKPVEPIDPKIFETTYSSQPYYVEYCVQKISNPGKKDCIQDVAVEQAPREIADVFSDPVQFRYTVYNELIGRFQATQWNQNKYPSGAPYLEFMVSSPEQGKVWTLLRDDINPAWTDTTCVESLQIKGLGALNPYTKTAQFNIMTTRRYDSPCEDRDPQTLRCRDERPAPHSDVCGESLVGMVNCALDSTQCAAPDDASKLKLQEMMQDILGPFIGLGLIDATSATDVLDLVSYVELR